MTVGEFGAGKQRDLRGRWSLRSPCVILRRGEICGSRSLHALCGWTLVVDLVSDVSASNYLCL